MSGSQSFSGAYTVFFRHLSLGCLDRYGGLLSGKREFSRPDTIGRGRALRAPGRVLRFVESDLAEVQHYSTLDTDATAL